MNPQDQDTIRELVESAEQGSVPQNPEAARVPAAVEPDPEPSAETQPEPDPAASTEVELKPLSPEESHLTLDDAKAIREAMEPFMRSHTVDRRHPAVALADQALAKHGLRFELGHYVPDGHYLDLQHSCIVKEGEYIEPVSKQPVPIPEGKRYDRHEGKLRG